MVTEIANGRSEAISLTSTILLSIVCVNRKRIPSLDIQDCPYILLYFYDTGLVCYLTRWSSAEVAESGAMSGALLENFTVSELMKSYQNAGVSPYLYFYRDRDAKEIDVVLEENGKLYPLEIKKTAAPDRRITNTFAMVNRSPLERGTGAVLCLAQEFSAFDRDDLIIPIGMI